MNKRVVPVAITVAIVVGEASGDILGSRLMASLKQLNPDIQFEGIGGKEMIQQGFDSLYPMETLSVMGFTEVIKRLPQLLSIRSKLIKRWIETKPDLVIGIDAPDFNLKLEARLHQSGLKVAHYVSPSVWAWRSKRVKKMQGNMDLMLTLFPFEADFYHQHGIPVAFVGHPLADEVPLVSDKMEARKALSLPLDGSILAILPGSRSSELKYLAREFILAANQLQQDNEDLLFVAPMANEALAIKFENIRNMHAPDLNIKIVMGKSRQVMTAADNILMASGTAVLEGMFIGRPMVAAGKLSAVTVWLVRTFGGLNVNYYTLPNNLANEALVAELIQENMTLENLVTELHNTFSLDKERKQYILTRFAELHQDLRKNASETAAKVLADTFKLS